jgi:hypothetical protein
VGKHSVPIEVPTTRGGRVGQRTRSGFLAFFLYGAPVLVFVGGIAVGVFDVSALQAALGHGTPGYFIAQSYGCTTIRSLRSCGWGGEFELTDGKVIGTDFAYQGTDPAMQAGTIVAALDPAGSLDDVFPRQWNWTWLANVIAALILCAGSGLWFWAAVRTARRDGARQRQPADVPL